MNKKGKLIVFSAPSGTGKSTIIETILLNHPDLVYSVSATTRKKRDDEIDGKHYFFLTEEDFKRKIANDEFIEWERFYDYYYGTLKSFVFDNLEKGNSVLLEVDVMGAISIKKIYADSVLIFITPPGIDVLKERLIRRQTDSSTDIQKRIERAELELSFEDKFDYRVVNDVLEEAINEVESILKNKI